VDNPLTHDIGDDNHARSTGTRTTTAGDESSGGHGSDD